MALIGMIHRRLVETGAVSEETFAEGVALGQILPGPVALDCATHIGHRLRGWLGAVVCAGGMMAPPTLLMLILTPLYLRFGRVPVLGGFFAGVAPAVVAVILATGWRMGRRSLREWRGGLIAALAAGGVLLKVNPALLIVLGGLLGMLLMPRSGQPAGGGKQS